MLYKRDNTLISSTLSFNKKFLLRLTTSLSLTYSGTRIHTSLSSYMSSSFLSFFLCYLYMSILPDQLHHHFSARSIMTNEDKGVTLSFGPSIWFYFSSLRHNLQVLFIIHIFIYFILMVPHTSM